MERVKPKQGWDLTPRIDISRVLNGLAVLRPIFHSEADFQHALAWQIHHEWPECSMRLEFKPPHSSERVYLDIWAADKDTVLAIELKYKTRGLEVTVQDEDFHLLDQSAQDLARYDYLKDIQRLERVLSTNKVIAYAIFLTNDSAYWKQPMNNQTVDASFRIHQGRNLTGELRWGTDASKGTTHGREASILIKGAYDLNWQNYSRIAETSYGTFKYLLVKVGSS